MTLNDEQKGALQHLGEYLLNRLKEPSSWVGIAVFVGFFGVSPETVERLTANGPAIVTAIGALLAVMLPSRSTRAVAIAKDAQSTAVEARETATAAAAGTTLPPTL